MFAQVVVHTDKPIDPTKFLSGIPLKGTREAAIEASRFAADPQVAESVVAWDHGGSTVSLFFPNGPRGIEVYVENHLDNGSITKLKRSSVNALQMLRDAAKQNQAKLDEIYIGIHGEDNLLQEGTPITFWGHIRRQFVDKIFAAFLIALAVGSVNLWAGANAQVAGWTFVATLVALSVRMGFEALSYRGGIDYADS